MNFFRSLYFSGKRAVDSVFIAIGFLIMLVIGTVFISSLGAINPIVFGSLIIGISIVLAAKIISRSRSF